MKFSSSVMLLTFGLMAAASPVLEERSPVPNVFIQPDADVASLPVPDAVNAITQPGCTDGKYRCAGIQGGCKMCVIAVGIGAGTCKLNNKCGKTNSCQYGTNGEPYCV